MNAPAEYLNPSEAARKLGVSVKALRIYEQRGLIAPTRTAAGWRTYGPQAMARAAEIVALRSLGLGLAEIEQAVRGDDADLDALLSAHQSRLEEQMRQLAEKNERVRRRRSELSRRQTDTAPGGTDRQPGAARPAVAFDLPWPWGGERFELCDIRPLNYLIGPLFSGKTKLAKRLAETLPGAAFIGLDRLADGASESLARLAADPALAARVDGALAELVARGADRSEALVALLAALKDDGPDILVIDLIEQGLDQVSQRALLAYLRGRGADARPLFVITRSNEILDLKSVGIHETIILCPANHSPPTPVAAYPGAPGYEAVATCLAAPEIRARTSGVIAMRTHAP
ncbi:MerR family transcriptional regulator [Nitratireductor sp. XY-223]|uniref:MerR family transcriptional regulator n=1 Tax=Nitratireductor sp. XY-223 TaxID=2561926 RepID=UPI0010A9F8FB|nr:MerR family transcriptional regulator [Nitratireductor sp. XY-223]